LSLERLGCAADDECAVVVDDHPSNADNGTIGIIALHRDLEGLSPILRIQDITQA
jgi:hypothetical protein